MAIIANVAVASTDTNTITSGAIDTTGANLLVLVSTVFNVAGATISDSKGNSWVANPPTRRTFIAGLVDCQIFYVANPVVGAAHTFTSTGSAIYPSIGVIALSGMATSTPLDVENGSDGPAGGPDTFQPGSITPSAANYVIIAGIAHSSPAAWTIDAPFTISDQTSWVSGQCDGIALAYDIQTTATARNPTWTQVGAGGVAAVIASFRVADAAPPPAMGGRLYRITTRPKAYRPGLAR